MTIAVIDNSWISYRHREDNDIARWEADEAAKTVTAYGDALQALTPGQDVTIGADWVHLNVPLDQDPVPVAIAAARLLRGAHDYRHDRPCDWHVKHIRQIMLDGKADQKAYEIGLNDNTNPGLEYSEEPEALKKRIGLR